MTESWRSAGRSATRVRIGSGSVSWRRRLWALTAPMPRSAQTAAIRSLVAQAGAGGPAVGELRLLVGEREVLALVLLGLDAADLVRATGAWSSSSTIRLRTGARPSPASSWLARAASSRRWPA